MNEQNMMEKQGVAIADYFWRLLEQWRGVLLVSLIFAVLFGGVGYVRSVREYQAAVKAQAEKKKQTTTSTVKDTMEDPVVTALTYYLDWQEKKTYYENHPLMRLDPSSEERMFLRYRIRAEDIEQTDLPAVIGSYITMCSDEAFVPAVRDCFSPEIPEMYLKDLVSVAALTGNQQIDGVKGRSITVTIVLPPRSDTEYDLEAIEKAMTGFVVERQQRLTEKLGNFSISLISRDHAINYIKSHVNLQKTSYSRMLSAEKVFDNAYSKLNIRNTRIVNEVLAGGNVRDWIWNYRAEEEHQKVEKAVAEPDQISRQRVSVRYPILGFVIGFFLYAGFLLVNMVFVRKIRDEYEFTSMTGLRSFGGVYDYPHRGFPGTFLHDRRVYQFRHREAARPFVEATRIAQKIAARAKHEGVESISLIMTGKSSDWGRKIADSQVKVLEQEQIRAVVIPAENGLNSVNEKSFNEMAPAVLMLQSGKTNPAMAVGFLVRLREYDVSVLGSEFLEGM